MTDQAAHERAIPALPCVQLEETLQFYTSLGFEVTYQQKSPYPYAVVRRGGIDLHFFGMKGLQPEAAFSTCLAVVGNVEQAHSTFSESLRRTHGRLPISGFPRITRFKPGQSRFTLVDPSGNSLIFVQHTEPSQTKEQAVGKQSRMAKAVEAAATLRDSKGDDQAAARLLDAVLSRDEECAPVDRARALAARAELAIAEGDRLLADALLHELQAIPLSDDDRNRFRHELEAASELERQLTPIEAPTNP